ncbi:MAG: tryptophan synthase subunit alpha [bacterium]
MKSKINQKIIENKNKPSLIPFVVSGFPSLEVTKQLLKEFSNNDKISAIEVGIPFSDPLADGPVIAKAAKEAIANGTNLSSIFEMLKEVKEDVSTPIILFSYVNPIVRMGIDTFFKKAEESGVSGLIIPDLPVEEADAFLEYCNKTNIDLIMLVAPTSDNQRINKIVEVSKGFIYLVSSTGVTGVREGFSDMLSGLIKEIRSKTDVPVCVGFGVSKAIHINELKNMDVNGAIVGSAIVKLIDENKHTPDLIPVKLNEYIDSLFSANGIKA